MVPRAGEQIAIANHIQARITAVDPGGCAPLQHRGDEGGARGVEHALVGGIAKDLVVRSQESSRKKLLDILELGLGLALEQRRDGLQRDLRRDLAFGVTTHTIGQHEQA
ncbi:hypothetical protein D3C71_1484240 [compost metagenome]